MKVLFFVYQIIFVPILFVLIALFSFKKRMRISSLAARYFPRVPQVKADVNFHVASIGEYNGIKKIAQDMKNKQQCTISFTCITDSVYNAIKNDDIAEFVAYLPVDFGFLYKRLFTALGTKICVISESEIWPGLLLFFKNAGIPYMYLNFRLSPHKLGLYKILKPFLLYFLRNAKKIFTAGAGEFRQLNALIGKTDNVIEGKNLKYSALQTDFAIKRDALMLSSSDFVVSFGSMHYREALVLNSEIKKLAEQGIKIIIAPRHLAESAAIKNLFSGLKLADIDNLRSDWQVLIASRFGILKNLYYLSDAAVVCGTFDHTGGHNILEPVLLDVPTFFGPNFAKYKEEYSALAKYYTPVIKAPQIASFFGSLRQKPEKLADIQEHTKHIIKEIVPSDNFFREVEGVICSFV